MSETTSEQWSQLAVAIDENPGAPAFPAVAELHRRAGRFLECETVLRAGLDRCPDSHEGRLILALGLLDMGREDEARVEFDHLTAIILASHGLAPGEPAEGPDAEPTDVEPPEPSDAEPVHAPDAEPVHEFDVEPMNTSDAEPAQATDAASESELEAAFDAAETDRDALIDPNRVAEEALEAVDRGAADGVPEDHDALSPGSPFATASMAALLADQGDVHGAERIRASLPPASPTPSERRSRVIATLEGWLSNIRGESR